MRFKIVSHDRFLYHTREIYAVMWDDNMNAMRQFKVAYAVFSFKFLADRWTRKKTENQTIREFL